MKSSFFKNLFEKKHDFPKDIVVLNFFKGWLLKHDKVLFTFFNNALKANKVFIEKSLTQWPIENQYAFLDSEILELESFIKKNPIHCKILFKKIGEVDELYDANDIIDLVRLIQYPFLEKYFSAIDYQRTHLKEEHFQNAETALEIINITIKLINEFRPSEKGINLEFYYWKGKNLNGLASYLVFLGCSIQIHYRLKAVKEQLVKDYPNIQKNKPKKKLVLPNNLIDKLPSDWKDKPFSEYFYFNFYQNYPKECKTFELKTILETRTIQQKIRDLNHTEKIKVLDNEIKLISEILDAPEIKKTVSLFNKSMEEHFTDLEIKIKIAQLTKESDSYIHSDEEISRSNKLLNEAELIQDLLLSNLNNQTLQSPNFKEDLNYLDKWMINPMVSGFLDIKFLMDKKEFINNLLNDLKGNEKNKDEFRKDNPKNGKVKWYNSDTPFQLPNGYRKILLNMTPQQERKFFSFLCFETNNSDSIFLLVEDGEEVFKYGFSIPNIPPKKYHKLNLKGNKRSKKVICICFYKLFIKQKDTINQEVKEELASFLKYYFFEFKDMEVQAIKHIMRYYKNQSYMKINIEKYLPK